MPVDYCSTGGMRLVGGETEAEGRLELCNNNRWGTVCGNEWTDNHTAVVCRHLGFSDITGGMYKQSMLSGSENMIVQRTLTCFRFYLLYTREVW